MNGPPMPPRCTLARFVRDEMDVEAVKAEGWNAHDILVVRMDDHRLRPLERQVLKQLGDRLYGRC